MKNPNKKTAVILFNLGGPNSLKAVKPFLFRLFNDKAIIGLPQPFRFFLAKFISNMRNKKAQKIYAAIGGKSPILETTLAQAHSLEKELSFLGDFKVFVAMRYAPPLASETIKEVMKYDPTNAILLPLYPQFSTTTSESSLTDFATKFQHQQTLLGKNIDLKYICCYPTQSDFIRSHAILIKQTIFKIYENKIPEFRFLFSAHGLPQKIIDAGDPYVFHVQQTTAKVLENLAQILSESLNQTAPEILAEIDHSVCFQSKVGPLQWTGPSLDFELRRAIIDKKIPVIIPISFVSDHSETLVELDIQYKELALSLGAKNYLRVPALNTDGHFIKSLKEICREASNSSNSACFSGQGKDRICPKNFTKCPNLNFCEA
jgi:ferrochelatase